MRFSFLKKGGGGVCCQVPLFESFCARTPKDRDSLRFSSLERFRRDEFHGGCCTRARADAPQDQCEAEIPGDGVDDHEQGDGGGARHPRGQVVHGARDELLHSVRLGVRAAYRRVELQADVASHPRQSQTLPERHCTSLCPTTNLHFPFLSLLAHTHFDFDEWECFS